ncbi:O-antigen ligase family protein [Bdellovibrio sp. SKB1291214]|uniref:O-antigen ligase family protein n=1 Tax=Bdellovibrio sp. SKB1291214 TaxID=1732569 RepID=UPI000B515211|nr:O-antigen ligase family protein [Bdellovibrio sp. SKB1291214]UYL08308.1 O-antigen ligase family protein [Bdellovibrio sp. SKB1291214]
MVLSYSKSPIEVESKLARQIWISLWVLFAISTFVSKSGITLFGTVLVIWSAFKIDWKKTVQYNPWFPALLALFPAAILVSLISLGGTEAAINVIRGFAWPLYVMPFSLLFADKKAFKAFVWALGVGLLVSCVNAGILFVTEANMTFNADTRVTSFWDISRWGYFLSCSAVVLFGLIGHKPTWDKATRLEKISMAFLLALSLVFLVLANTRGPFLAAIVGIGLLGISNKRSLKMLGGFVLFTVLSLLVVPGTLDRFQSSFSAKKENGVITSQNASNAGRLHMWQVNVQLAKEQPFFGTGFETAEKPLRAFIEKQGEEFREKYIDHEFSFKDQHNAYLHTFVQLGVFYFLFIWSLVGALMFLTVRAFFKGDDILVKIAFALILNQLFVFIFYSSVSSYEALWFYPMLLVMSASVMQDRYAAKKIAK